MLVHVLEEIAQATAAIGETAHFKVDEKSEDLALGIVGDAALRATIVGVCVEPCIQTGLLDRLRETGAARLQSCDHGSKMCEQVLLVGESRAHLNDVGSVLVTPSLNQSAREYCSRV